MKLAFKGKKIHICLALCLSEVVTLSAPKALGENNSSAPFNEYSSFLDEERANHSPKHNLEVAASGIAGLVIGLYGYYFTDAGPVTRLLYAATQTAGVITFGEAIRQYYSPSLYIAVDEKLAARDHIPAQEVRDAIMRWKHADERARLRALTYTSAILSGLYFYDGIREKEANQAVRNIYYFLGINTALVAAIGAYRLQIGENTTSVSGNLTLFPGGVQLSLLF